MSDYVTDVEDRADFQQHLDSNDVVVVKFWATWCGPCKQLAPHYESLAESSYFKSDMLGRTKFLAVDVDKADWAVLEYGVRGVPTVKLFINGVEQDNLKSRTAPLLMKEIKDAATSD